MKLNHTLLLWLTAIVLFGSSCSDSDPEPGAGNLVIGDKNRIMRSGALRDSPQPLTRTRRVTRTMFTPLCLWITANIHPIVLYGLPRSFYRLHRRFPQTCPMASMLHVLMMFTQDRSIPVVFQSMLSPVRAPSSIPAIHTGW